MLCTEKIYLLPLLPPPSPSPFLCMYLPTLPHSSLCSKPLQPQVVLSDFYPQMRLYDILYPETEVRVHGVRVHGVSTWGESALGVSAWGEYMG